MLRKVYKNGQTSIEYTVLLIIVIGALLAMQNYMKRGIQGRWRDSVDDMGDQYDPLTTSGNTVHTVATNTVTKIWTVDDAGGYWTNRTDDTNSSETKSGEITVGAY